MPSHQSHDISLNATSSCATSAQLISPSGQQCMECTCCHQHPLLQTIQCFLLVFSHPAAFAQNWDSFPSRVLWKKPSENCVPNENTRRGNSMQEANVLTAFNSLSVSGSCSEAVFLPQAVHQTLAPRVSHLLVSPRSQGSSPSQGKARSQLLACASWEMGLCSSHYLLFIDKAVTLDSF